jgi:peptidoglycan/LPS O-acetylase OafA/YrhL
MNSSGGVLDRTSVSVRLGRLDAIRASCALYVAVYHVVRNTTETGLRFDDAGAGVFQVLRGNLLGLFAYGHYAVLAFFLLSGYSIHGSLVQRNYRIDSIRLWMERYVIRRFFRIMPTLVVGVAVTVGVSSLGVALFPGTFAFAIAGSHGASPDIGEALRVLVLQYEDGLVGANDTFWSVQVEVVMYALYVPVALLAARLRRAVFVALVVSLTIAVPVYVHAAQSGLSTLPLLTIYYLPAWLAGAWLAEVANQRSAFVQRHSVRLAGLGACSAVALTVVSANEVRLPIDLAWTAALAMVLLGIVVQPATGRLMPRAARSLADCSYSLYLVHVPVQLFFLACVTDDIRPGNPMVAAGALASSIVVALAVSWLIERPSHRLGRSLAAGIR